MMHDRDEIFFLIALVVIITFIRLIRMTLLLLLLLLLLVFLAIRQLRGDYSTTTPSLVTCLKDRHHRVTMETISIGMGGPPSYNEHGGDVGTQRETGDDYAFTSMNLSAL